MYQAGFSCYNVKFQKYGASLGIRVKGQIRNNSLKNYVTAVFKITVFDKDVPLWGGAIRIRNFKRRQTKDFELIMEGMRYEALSRISKYEIYFDSGY